MCSCFSPFIEAGHKTCGSLRGGRCLILFVAQKAIKSTSICSIAGEDNSNTHCLQPHNKKWVGK